MTLLSDLAARFDGTTVDIRKTATPLELAAALDRRIVITPALQLITERLLAISSQPSGRLIISIPPQEAKTTTISKWFPIWWLMRHPETRFGIASYELGVARRIGRGARDEIVSYGTRLGLSIRPDVSAQNEWQLANGHQGGVYAAGVGGAWTSRPVDFLIIDDPHKDRDEAESPVFRERVWDWWTDVATPRLAPGAPVVLVMTRWHEDDLAGRLIATGDWEVINIPAQADHRPEKGETDALGRQPGEWLKSARKRTVEQWEAIKVAVGARTFAALYQGRPAPVEGTLLKRSFWQRYDIPKAVRSDDGTMAALGADEVIQSWDMAFKDKKSSDYVVGQVWGRWGNDVYLLDQVHDRLSFTATVEAVRRLSKEWPQARVKLVEDKANGTAVIDHLHKEITGLIPVPVKDGKYARAVAVSPFIESRHVFIPADNLASWAEGFLEEQTAFPNTNHDDQVDAMTQALDRLLGHPLAKATVSGPQQRPPIQLPSGFSGALSAGRGGFGSRR